MFENFQSFQGLLQDTNFLYLPLMIKLFSKQVFHQFLTLNRKTQALVFTLK